MVFVSGMKMACTNMTRRNSFILMLSLAFGLGVALEPQLFEGGGGFAFYSNNLAHNIGFWPKSLTCDVFPTKSVTTINTPSSCDVGGTMVEVSAEVCTTLGGLFTAEDSTTENVPAPTCANNNGLCCLKYNEGAKSVRTTIILILKTPYCIGFLIAMFLNLLLPEDKSELEEMELENQKVKALEKL
jgi:xanthine/uracil permease